MNREPSGRLSRRVGDRLDGLDREQQDAISVGIEARQRVFGVPVALSRDQMAGSAVGRLRLQGLISRAQYDAAIMLQQEREDYSRACGSPRQPGAVDLNATKGVSNYENVEWVQRVKADRKATDKALMAKQIEVGNFGNLYGALDAVVMQDTFMDHLLGDLRIALNALVKRYGLEAGRAAA